MHSSLTGTLIAVAVSVALAPMQASAQDAIAGGTLAGRGVPDSVPRFASTVPAAPGDVPGVSLAYEEPTPVVQPGSGYDGYRAWGQYVFTSARLGADRNGAAIRSSSNGFSVGIEKVVDPSLTLGVSFGYSQGRATLFGVRADNESFAGAAYAWWNPVGGLEIDALLGANGLSVDTRRLVTLAGNPAVLTGSTGGIGFSGLAAAGYRFRFEQATLPAYVKPFVSLSYANQDRSGYAETAPGGGLAFPGRTFERATVNLGAAVGVDLPTPWGVVVRPEVSLSWSRHLIDPSPAVSAFDITTGQGYVLRDPRPGQDGLLVATEVAMWESQGLQTFVGYTGEFRNNATAHQARVGLRASW